VIGGAIGGIVGAVGYTAYVAATGKEFNSTHFWIATGGGAVAGALIGTGVGFAAGVGVAEATTAAVGVGEAANVACGGDMCASEAQQLGQTAQEALPVVENAATQVGDDIASAIKFDPVQVQEKFKHAIDFGINGNYSLDNASRFVDAMKQHVNSAGTQVIQGTYRTTIQTINYFNQGTGLNVFTDTENNFISGWKLSVQQAYYLLQKGNLK
jgi:hypothetical protein